MNIRGKVLRDADHCINGEREGQYGSPEDNFRKIAILWSDYIQLSHDTQMLHLTPADVAKMMVLFKLARSMGPQDKYDNYVDLIGYAACAAEAKSIEDPSLIGFENQVIMGPDIENPKDNCALENNADIEKAFNMVRAIENPHPTEIIAKIFNKGRGWEACEDCLHAESDEERDRNMCVACRKLQGLKPSNWQVKPVPKNTINRDCSTCVSRYLDRDAEDCLNCDPKTRSNWKYEED